jgi:dihydroxy-acid dehydratase
MTFDLKHKSRLLLDGRDRAPARSYLKAIGYSDEDLARPIVGIANTWTETMPCNFHLRRLAEHVKRGVRTAGGTPMEFNTIAISDGITMGTLGMKTSLISRELIADSIDLMGRGICSMRWSCSSAAIRRSPGLPWDSCVSTSQGSCSMAVQSNPVAFA